MAASTRVFCCCPPSVLFQTLKRMGSFWQCAKQMHTKNFLLHAKAPVVTARGRLNVTSTWHLSVGLPSLSRPHQSLDVHNGLVRCAHSAMTLFESSNGNKMLSDSQRVGLLFPHKHNVWQMRTVFLSRVLDSPGPIQSESKTSSAGQHVNGKGYKCGKSEKRENIKTIPNLLTALRMASAPLLGYMVLCEHFGIALGLLTFAGISDLLDGYIARNFANQTSALGSALDPLADKLLVTILAITLTSVGLIPLPLTGLIVFRDITLIAGGFYIRYRSLPPPITLSRYFDISHATVSWAPTFISKVNTGLQLSLLACSLAAPVFGFVDHLALQTLWWTTGATTFLSGVDYLRSWKKHVTLLEKDQKEL